MKRGNLSLLCFDLDNTLIYADRARAKSYLDALRTLHLPLFPEKTFIFRFGVLGSVFIRQLFPYLRDAEVSRLLRLQHTFMSRYVHLIRPIPRIITTLRKLQRSYRLAVVSNCRRSTILKSLKAAHISASLFDYIIGHDSVAHPKPAPDAIIKAEHLAHLHASFMVGDTIYDIIAAKKARVRAIGVVTGVTSAYQLRKYKPFSILKSVAELPRFLKNYRE